MRVFALLVLVPLVKRRHEASGLRGRDVWFLMMRGGGGRAIPPGDDEAADISVIEVLKRVMARGARGRREKRGSVRFRTCLSFVPPS